MTTDTDTFTFDRDFGLPPARMWHLMTSNEGREAWGAPEDGLILETLSSDFRIGGEERHRCGPAENPHFEVTTRWYNIAEPSDAVYTEQIEAGGMALGASLVTYRIVPNGTGSKVTVTVAVSSYVGPEMIGEFRAGWEGGIAKLTAMVSEAA